MNNNFKTGDKVLSKKTGKIYTIVDIDPCKIEDENLQVWSADLEHLELVATHQSVGGQFLAYHIDALEREVATLTGIAENYRTELDAAKGIAEALEEEVAQLKEWKRQQILVVKVPELVNKKQLEKELLMESVQFGGSDPYEGMSLGEALATVKPEDIDPPDYAGEAKDILQKMLNPHFEGGIRMTSLDTFVDLIIKAAKQH